MSAAKAMIANALDATKSSQDALVALALFKLQLSTCPELQNFLPAQDIINNLSLSAFTQKHGEGLVTMDADSLRKKMIATHVSIVKSRLFLENCGIYHHHVAQCSNSIILGVIKALESEGFSCEFVNVSEGSGDEEPYYSGSTKEDANVIKVSI
jgi:hypothetical protein